MPLDITNLPAIVSAFGGLLSIGAVGWWLRSGTDIVLAKRDAAEAKKDATEAKAQVAVLVSRVNQQDTIITEVRSRLGQLDRVPELITTLEFIKDAVIRNMVPRGEIMQRWDSIEQRFARIEADVRNIQDHTIHPA